jgi:peptidoglycan/xylan/chitin deacetylase (PgdA/CDA1 family)
MESKMDKYLEILSSHGIGPTFPISGKVLNDHLDVVRKYYRMGVEFAVHGYHHIDYSNLTYDDSLRDLGEAVRLFKENNIFSSGCRFPYLKYGKECMAALKELSFKWDSSHTILWEVMEESKVNSKKSLNYRNMLDQYNYKPSSRYLSLPKYYDGLLEIPVSLPDDDLLERLGIKDNKAVGEIWGGILQQTHSRGEMFTLQLHPERILVFKEALKSMIQSAKESYPRVWISSLGNIYAWWKEKEGFTITLKNEGNSEYQVEAKCSPRATLLVRSKYLAGSEFYSGYSVMKKQRFSIRSNKVPIVGIPKDSSRELVSFLKNEGFIFEMSEEKERYSVYLNNAEDFLEKDEVKTLETIHSSDLPLIRFWRWPGECKSALSITGDIDALSSADFLLRILELR